METAGEVVIQISANAAAFEAALNKAQQQATQFDAAVTAKLSGAGMSAGLAKIAGLIETNNQLLSKMVGTAAPAAASLEKVTAATKSATAAAASFSTALSDVRASYQPLAAAGQQYGASLVQVNDANRIGVELEKQKTTLIAGTIGALTGQVGTAKAVAAETEHMASASRLGAAQMAALGHSARSAVETLALGVSPLQALTQQANHLSFALSGPQGLIAASEGAREAFAGWLVSGPGLLTGAGVAAAAAVATYALATRERIASVDELLQGHKKLLDDIANSYPHLSDALKRYADEAAKLPHSVLAADTQTQIDKDQKALSASLDHLLVDLRELAAAQDVVGSAGAEAFGRIADTVAAGKVDVDKLVGAVGDIRLNPEITPQAKEFAERIQQGALEAQKLQDILNKDLGLKDVQSNGGKVAETLFSVSKGLNNVESSAGGANAVIAKMFGTLNSNTGQFGVERSLQSTLAGFQQVDQAVQEARRNQLSSFMDLDTQLQETRQQADQLKQAMATAAGADNAKAFFGDVTSIANANSELQRSVDTANRLFDAMNAGGASTRTVFEGLSMIRETLVRDGFGVDAVNKFLDSLVKTRMQLDQDTAGARQLNAAIQAIRNKTVTVTVVTRRIGTGTQSLYDVPSSDGGTGSVGVTRYGGDGTGPSLSSYSVPTEGGYGSQGGVGSGSSTVNVTRFGGTRAGGGPMDALLPYWVGEHGPELVVPSGAGTVVPNPQSTMFAQALASAQSGFTGREPTQDLDRMWTVQMNIEANTRKTSELLDDIKTATANSSSALGGSSYGGSSSGVDTSEQDQLSAQYIKVLQQIRSNFRAAGIVGRGIIGYGSDGLAATPEQIARNIVYGGAQPVLGFATGGMIAPGDSQEVRLFKSPDEVLAVFTPQQMQALKGAGTGQTTQATADQRPINVSLSFNLQSGAQVSNDSVAEIRRQTALAVRDAIRSINGR